MGRGVLCGALLVLGGCRAADPHGAGPYTVVDGDPRREGARVPDVSQREWSVSRDRFANMREELPTRPYAQRVRIAIVDPRTGKVHQAHGAIAVSPGRAARLVLAGAAGSRAVDAWVSRDRFHVTIPSIKLDRRGKALVEASGIPLGLLRWWFVAPLDGRLVLARSSRSESSFVLRDGAATVTMRTDGENTVAVRREPGRVEGLEWSGQGLSQPGARGQYIDGAGGVRLFIVLGDVLDAEPDPATFLDADDQGTSL